MERDRVNEKMKKDAYTLSERNEDAWLQGVDIAGRMQELNRRVTKGLHERERLQSAETAN